MEPNVSSIPSIFWRHRWSAITTFAAVICGAILYIAVTPPKYEATIRVMLNNKQLSVSDIGRDLATLPNLPETNPVATEAELARSQRVLKQALSQLPLKGIKDLPTSDTVKNDLKVTTVPATNILEMSYKSQNPLLTFSMLNAIAEAMIEENAEVIRSQASVVRRFLENELPKQRSQLATIETAIAQYKSSQGIVSTRDTEGNDSIQTQSLVTSLADLDRQELALSSQLQDAKIRNNSLRQTTDADTIKNAYAIVRAGQDEDLKRLRTKLAELDSQVAISRTQLTNNNPVLIKLLQQQAVTRNLYSQKLSRLMPKNTQIDASTQIASDQLSQDLATKYILGEIESSGLEANLAKVRSARANLQVRLERLPEKELQLAALTRQRQEVASSVESLQKKLEEARIAEVQLSSNIRIIDTALPPKAPNWPNRKLVFLLATVTGIILALGVVLLLEILDGTLRNATEVEKLLNKRVLGVLPVLPSTSLDIENFEMFLAYPSLVEPYRKLLNSIEFSTDKGSSVIVVSSTVSREGKSVVVSHIAAVSAMLSRRTLIIDTDSYSPRQHKIFNLAAQPGLTDIIDGDVTLAQAVQQTSNKHLWLLSCGKKRPHPSLLLSPARMHTLLAEAAAHYDLVIIDTLPVTSSVDALALSHNSNGLLLVARPEYTQKDALLRSVADLIENQVRFLGIIVNGMNSQTEKYYRYPIEDYQSQDKQQNYFQRLFKDADK
jgi:polysaccharide biosynthesis transport protein